MGANALSNRDNWQDLAGKTGKNGETTFASAVRFRLPPHYEVVENPPKLTIYSDGKGIVLDTKITNTKTGKSLYVEKKTGNKGGNAHERVYKYLSEPLKRLVRHNDPSLADEPFFLVFSGTTFEGQKYQDEIKLLLEDANYAIIEQGFNETVIYVGWWQEQDAQEVCELSP